MSPLDRKVRTYLENRILNETNIKTSEAVWAGESRFVRIQT